ncbi:SGNH/GDSL hydrolase family protein [Glutamicibacter sp. PS]|uniref:SGNH/GDSL hydrolase family protein n=1 Tax=Glutamicibacter sp. PS TaxID=3075634 RepID=UPI00283B014D|nr:SGNH/GDSL hydrolase family protein [Glutamicibacter sp. PS]MDR4533664.1 SGNH/GDSL hydrolase family protein [Glutamicibacter sp. PS]
MPDHERKLYVAIGDSFTEGVGDWNKQLPNGVRGWADRVAEQLAKNSPGWQYANLAVRSKRMRHIIADQLEPAVAMNPTLITLYAGGNDIMDLGTSMEKLMADYRWMAKRLAATGARLVLFTGYNVKVSLLLEPLKKRNAYFNEQVRAIAKETGALLLDYETFTEYEDRRMWGDDRLHMSKAGHKYLAHRVLKLLGIKDSIKLTLFEPPERRSLRQRAAEQRQWINDWVLPLMGRKVRGVTMGDHLTARWPRPVTVPEKGGLRKFAKKQRKAERARRAA